MFGEVGEDDADPPEFLLKSGMWKDARPTQEKEPFWSNDVAWRIGWCRAAYKQFYESTGAGRACAMAPRAERFDDIGYWVDVETPRQVSTSELADQITAVARRVNALWTAGKLLVLAGAAIAAARFFWK